MINSQITELRATCPDCKVDLCMRHSGDGEWICESRKSKFCGIVIPESRIPKSRTKSVVKYLNSNQLQGGISR